MGHWKSLVKQDQTSWLLENENPSVRYFTLRDIEGLPPDHPELIQARRRIMENGIVPQILSKQHPDGYWFDEESFYQRKKYKGTGWTMLYLTQLGADPHHPGIRKACESLLRSSFIREGDDEYLPGGFAYSGNPSTGGKPRNPLPTHTGNMLYVLLSNGYETSEPRIAQTIHWFNRYQRYDQGNSEPPDEWLYRRFEMCYGKHTCVMGVVKMLKAFALIPPEKRSEETQNSIRKGVGFLLNRRIYKRVSHPSQIGNEDWIHFNFPLVWNTDALEMFQVLLDLGVRDERMKDAAELILSKQNEEGKWIQEQRFQNRFIISLEPKNKPSKWMTYLAMKAIKRYYE